MINSKLRSRKGATLLFALVAMLVAVIVSAVIIYAAMSNVGRIRSDQAAEQALLTLNSAASLVRSELADDSVGLESTKVTINKVEQPDLASGSIIYKGLNSSGNVQEKFSGVYTGSALSSASLSYMETMVLNWVAQVDANPNTDVCRAEFLISTDNESMKNVKVTLMMEPGSTGSTEADEVRQAAKYYITAYVYFEDETIDSETIRLTFMSSVSTSTSSPKRETVSGTSESGVTTNMEKITISETSNISWTNSNVVVNVFPSKELAGWTAD